MNNDQLKYATTYFIEKYIMPFPKTQMCTGITGLFTAFQMFPTHPSTSLFLALTSIGVSYLSVANLFFYGNSLTELAVARKNICRDPAKYPLEHVNEIFFEDTKGLECLLECTQQYLRNEWGTVLHARANEQKAYIDNILHPDTAQKYGFVSNATETSIGLNITKIEDEGYTGGHHYHPTNGSMNFLVHAVDRICPLNWINLLTFNIHDRPEIIGYNKQHVYIPVDVSKRKLIKATKKDILKYLS